MVFIDTFRLKKDSVTSNGEIQIPDECQKPDASEIGRQHHVAIQLWIHVVVMLFGLHLAFDSLDLVIPCQRLLSCSSPDRDSIVTIFNTGDR